MKKRNFLLCLICLSGSYLLSAQNLPDSTRPDPKFSIYLLMGQSNMAGRGEITEGYKSEGNPRVFMLDKARNWVPAKHPLHFDKTVAGVGPGLAFALRLAAKDTTLRIGLVPCAVGGTSIRAWVPGGYDSATKTHPYDDALVRIKTAMKAGTISGMLWHQGEADSKPSSAEHYIADLSTLIGRVRAVTGNPNLPVVAGELGRYRPQYQLINNELGRIESRIPNTAVASSSGFIDKGDGTHFSSASASMFGERFADQMLNLQKKGQPEVYPVDSASVAHAGVPKGEVLKFTFENSKIFPGTWREYWIYVPQQYKGDKPACVYINQDGIQNNAPVVFDNLINSGEMPVTIGVFVMHGRVRSGDTANALDRFNRSFEYDGLGDNYARFLLEELLPEVQKQKTSDGRAIKLSSNGNDRALGGSSSGAVCAFTAAWERPDAFSKVFSSIGTYVGLRGGDRYSTLIRKYEPKPIRIFLQDGSNDNNIYAGDWWKANEMMERSLTFAGYEVEHVWGEGSHNGRQASAIFPQAMRWLWRTYPKPVVPGESKNQFLTDILLPGENWELVGEGYGFTEGIAPNSKGEVFFQDVTKAQTYKVDLNGKATRLSIDSKNASGTSFDAGGNRYVVSGKAKQVLMYDANGKESVIADSASGNDIVISSKGNIYITTPINTEKNGKLYLVKKTGEKVLLDDGLRFPNGLTISPDGTQVYVTESATHWVWAYQVQADGKLAYKQKYGWLHVPDAEDNAWSDGLKCDRQGRVYVATRLGIQVLDQTGRVNAIIPVPSGQSSNLCFGGKNFDILYVTSNDKVYRRKVKVRGANTFETNPRPAPPRL